MLYKHPKLFFLEKEKSSNYTLGFEPQPPELITDDLQTELHGAMEVNRKYLSYNYLSIPYNNEVHFHSGLTEKTLWPWRERPQLLGVPRSSESFL